MDVISTASEGSVKAALPANPDLQVGISLDDKYSLESGSAVVTGTQALVLLMMMQRRRDRRLGLNTAGLCTGYRGSPLSTLDQEFQRAQKFLTPLDIRYQGGVNEALAATVAWGTQLLHIDAAAKVDGVFAMWYGKGAGLDQCIDVMRHANNAGTAPRGGVLAVVGDDHAMKSSAQAHHCEPAFADMRIPVLYPSDIQEMLRFGLLGYALSRDSGSWVGLKTLPELVNSSAVIEMSIDSMNIALPASESAQVRNRHVQWPDPWPAGEVRFHQLKWPRILEFIRLNDINRVVLRASRPRLGIVTAGKSYGDLLEALAQLDLSLQDAERLGVSIYKVGCPWPLEPSGIVEFARQQPMLLVIEEKRATIEDQLKAILYDALRSEGPAVYGRFGAKGEPLLPNNGEATPELIAQVLVELLSRVSENGTIGIRQVAARLAERERQLARLLPGVMRTPFFCSGCPHNTSTKVPDGSTAMAGIGCHGMAMFAADGRTATHTHMGGEGATWIGRAPYTSVPHIFQNLGEGTYHHSGSLTIRAAVSAGVNITYKILFNDAVAMTGGQAIDGVLSVPQLAHQVRAEGVKRIALVSDEPNGIDARELPQDATIHHRDALDQVQRELREIPGVTVLIYVQTCATEKRRRRKRGLLPEPAARVFINPDVCEGCGDCSAKSNCLSVVPIETELGRKRRIDQSACNKDLSCLKGFCPSFVTVEGAQVRRRGRDAIEQLSPHLQGLPTPPLSWDGSRPYNILCTGIGGTGVVTVGALIVTAARIAGLAATVHDRLGMAQKFGAVTSHIRIASAADQIATVRIPMGRADAVLGGDVMVTAQPDALRTIAAGSTRVILNTDEAAPGAFVSNPDFDFQSDALIGNVRAAAGGDNLELIEAAQLATTLIGDAIATNVFLLGYALQRGLVPVPVAAIERAIELNGTAVATTKQTLALGRLASLDIDKLREAIAPVRLETVAPRTLDELIEHRKKLLVDYQDEAYASRYLDLVERVRSRERQIMGEPGELTAAAAKYYFKVLAYKDEYEVARLYSSPQFRRRLELEFTGPYRLSFRMAPPLLGGRDPVTGEPRKRAFGGWMLWALRALAPFKFLRGTPFDPFAYSADRRLERRLIGEYEAFVARALGVLTRDNYETAVRVLSMPEQVRGFGPVKERHYHQAMTETRKASEQLAGGVRNTTY